MVGDIVRYMPFEVFAMAGEPGFQVSRPHFDAPQTVQESVGYASRTDK
jgi:hypothetical protein